MVKPGNGSVQYLRELLDNLDPIPIAGTQVVRLNPAAQHESPDRGDGGPVR